MLEDGGEEFETTEDLYDAVGIMLQQADENRSDEEVKAICERLLIILHGYVE